MYKRQLQDRTEQLKANRVVKHLIENPGQAFAREDKDGDFDRLDDTHRPQDVLAPLLSDSSQLKAICVVDSGRDLVLEGPPGTGKSQTITNLKMCIRDSGSDDEAWHRQVRLVLAPNPELPEANRRVIELDYGMTSGAVTLDRRQALLFYSLKRLGLLELQAGQPHVQQIVLRNREEIAQFLPRSTATR